MRAAYTSYRLNFLHEAKTSRETMLYKDTYFIKVWDELDPKHYGIGECALFKGLSSESDIDYDTTLLRLCKSIAEGEKFDISQYSSIRFGLETAMLAYDNDNPFMPFPSQWTAGKSEITINGLIWMGNAAQMEQRISEKVKEGFSCIKIKIGGINFNEELKLIDHLRCQFPPEKLVIRLDANGAFSPEDAEDKIKRLSVLDIHSIEQPIKAGLWDQMAYLCANSPIPIALDEELIGVRDNLEKHRMLFYIAPQYIIVKPSLCGGFSGASEWITQAEEKNIGWWVTSALESNIGLNALSQWVGCLEPNIPQGLGTGQLYTNNFPSPLTLIHDKLKYNPASKWELYPLNWIEP